MRVRDLSKNVVAKIAELVSVVDPDELRPTRFSDFIGQGESIAQLELMCGAAKARGEPVEHLLMTGPGGLGKTTLALMISTEMGGQLYATTAPTLGPETLGKILSASKRNSVIFIDEIHGLSKRTYELLYGAMEDGWFDMPTPVGPERRPVKPFTLVGATTDPGRMTDSFKDRFGHIVQLTFYSYESMVDVLTRSADHLGMKFDSASTIELVAERSRGVPRVGNMHLRRIRDYTQSRAIDLIDSRVLDDALSLFGVDELGLTSKDRLYLTTIHRQFKGGPVGVEQLGIALGEDTITVAKDIEPYLMRLGLIARAPRGRTLTNDGRTHIREFLGEE